jgi:hypothetical protein
VKKTSHLAAVTIAFTLAAGAMAPAAEVTVGTVDQLRNALYAASPGDRIYVEPGNYNSRLWVSGISGTPGNLIEVVAQDPTNRPVFEYPGDSCFTIANSSYVLVDGIITQGSGTPTSAGNNFEFPVSHHMIARNVLSRDCSNSGNADGTKFASTNNMLMYNCRVETWGAGGSAADIMNNHNSLFMRNSFSWPGDPYNANGFQPKGDGAYELGFYRNTFIDGGARCQQFGGSSGASTSEGHDMVAMGNVFDQGDAAVAYVSCTDCEFSYNTVVNPENWVMRILNENGGVPQPSFNTFKRNIVEYGPISVQNVGANTQPETFTYRENFWYKWSNPGGSVPSLPGAGEIDPAPDSGTDPQLDADYRPALPGAKAYGAHAPAVEAQFASYQSWFQWAWDRAEEIDPDASGSYAGAGAYDADLAHPQWHQVISSWQWDLDYDGASDDASGETAAISYDDLVALGLGAGVHTVELKITVSTPYGPIVEWKTTQLEMLSTPHLLGDANVDGEVDGADYTTWADNYLDSPVAAWADGGWAVGNFNADDIVDGADYTLWADNYTGGGAPVPEPATLAVLATGACLSLLRKRR